MSDKLEEIKQFRVSGDTAWAWSWLITEVERLRGELKETYAALHDLADCADKIVNLEGEKATLTEALKETTLMLHRGYLHKEPFDICSVGQCAINRSLLALAKEEE